jgi:hypothetical protein
VSGALVALLIAGGLASACADETGAAGQERTPAQSERKVMTMKIRMDVEGTVVTATLLDNEAARDFASLLPLTLTLKDYAAAEKISDLPKRLATRGVPAGMDPTVGDVAYYSPWGNLAVFYKDSGYASGLVKLGRIDSGGEAFKRPVPLRVTIEAAK